MTPSRGSSRAWDPGRVSRRSKLSGIARLIRVEHTLFSLPFAYAGAMLSRHAFTWGDALLIGLALLGLRSAAMAYNNIADYDIDSLNPRTASRPLITGVVTRSEAWGVVAAGSLLYYASAALLNLYALLFSPLLWILALTYPHAKRHHSYPHFHLGLVLGMAVFGGAVAAAGDESPSLHALLAAIPWLYIAAVTLWVAGFDIIYSVMDMGFDREHGLGSIPAKYGLEGALAWSLASFLGASALLVAGALVYRPPAGPATLASSVVASSLMLYSWYLAYKSEDNIPRAFNLNLLVGVIAASGVIVDYLLELLH